MDCRKCKNGHYTGGQIAYAQSEKKPVYTLNYIYCKGTGYVDIQPQCEKFELKITEIK